MLSPIPTYIAVLNTYDRYMSLPPTFSRFHFNSRTNLFEVKMDVSFVPHPVYGNTQFRLREWYDSLGNKVQYRYCWEASPDPADHITAWENEHPYGFPNDPHHHHHVPFNRKEVQDNPNVRSIADAFGLIIPYIQSGHPYP